uniref:Uncharacterized protein n=1 Tax=Anguilla anguilla TaxID=7936 RepID=A0A0E9WN68_ANGAN
MLRQELSSKINTAYEVPSPFKTNIINAKLFWMIEISCLFIRSSRFAVPAIRKKYYVTVWKYFICTYISSQCCLNASINFFEQKFQDFQSIKYEIPLRLSTQRSATHLQPFYFFL